MKVEWRENELDLNCLGWKYVWDEINDNKIRKLQWNYNKILVNKKLYGL